MTPLIIISGNAKSAIDWANDGRLPRLSYIIITNELDLRKLNGLELTLPLCIARVSPRPVNSDYIEDYIRARTRK